MKVDKRNWYAPASVLAVLLVCLVSLIIWGSTESNSILAQTQERQASKQSMQTREDSNLNILTSLLSRDGISVQNSALLPNRVSNSNTVLVRFESKDMSSREGGIRTVMPQEFSLSRLNVKPNTGALKRQRSLELSPTLLLIVAVNQNKQTLWWSLLPDPRVVRAETADTSGTLSGQTLYRSSAETLVSYPANKSVSELRFYHPTWNGKEYSLDLIGLLSVPPTE